MISKWFEYKEHAISLRKNGSSITYIERTLGIPRSTLSGWFKDVEILPEYRALLQRNKNIALARARQKAAVWHRQQKEIRLAQARTEAEETFSKLDINSNAVLDLAFAMLYMGEGSKSEVTSLASSDPQILKFVIAVLSKNYGIKPEQLKCDLHLRADQDPKALKRYWSSQLHLPLDCFRKPSIDQRTVGRSTYEYYKGVCVITGGNIAIQRKLMYLYTLFCDAVIKDNLGD